MPSRARCWKWRSRWDAVSQRTSAATFAGNAATVGRADADADPDTDPVAAADPDPDTAG